MPKEFKFFLKSGSPQYIVVLGFACEGKKKTFQKEIDKRKLSVSEV